MHSRVFCMVTKLDQGLIERALDIYEDDIVNWISGADYASERNELHEVQDDVDWLIEWIGKDDDLIEPQIVSYDDEDYYYWPIPVEKLKQKLEEEVKRRIENIKKMLESPMPSLHDIAYEAYNQKGFYFWIDGEEFVNEIDLYEFFLNSKHNKDLSTLYVVGSFDYHF